MPCRAPTAGSEYAKMPSAICTTMANRTNPAHLIAPSNVAKKETMNKMSPRRGMTIMPFMP